jgi:predicted N-formylglutamate amidohydrolase
LEASAARSNPALKSGEKVIHVGVHTFTPVLHGHRRKTEIGLLYDPSRVREEDFCLGLQKFLRLHSNLAVHRNLPYRGTGNGLVMALRKEFPLSKYLGLELEINQRLLGKKREIAALIGTSLQKML